MYLVAVFTFGLDGDLRGPRVAVSRPHVHAAGHHDGARPWWPMFYGTLAVTVL